MSWDWFWSDHLDHYYHKTPLGWETWVPYTGLRARSRFQLYEAPLLLTKPPSAMHLLSVSLHGNMVKGVGWDYWGFSEPSVAANDVDPSSVSFPDAPAVKLVVLVY